MATRKRIKEQGFYERIYQATWDQYILKSSSVKNTFEKVQLMLVIIGITLTIFLTTGLIALNVLIPETTLSYLSTLLFIVIIVLALDVTLVRRFWIPYLERVDGEKYAKNNDAEGFFRDCFNESHVLVHHTNEYTRYLKKQLKRIFFIFLVAAYLPLFNKLYFISMPLSVVSVILFMAIFCRFYSTWDTDVVKSKKE